MTDPLQLAVKEAILSAGFGWDKRTCDTMADGHPPPNCGDWFLAIHGLSPRSDMDNALNEYFGFSLTLTQPRISGVPWDRVGDVILVQSKAILTQAKETGFDARAEQLRAFLHMNWAVIGIANTLMTNMDPNANTIYGFCEPARYRSREDPPVPQGADWFAALPPEDDSQAIMGITSELRFEDARRLQPIASYT